MAIGTEMREQAMKGKYLPDVKVRLGFWSPVYGNWIVSKHPETLDASFDYTRKLTLLAEEIGFATVLIAEHTFNPIDEVAARRLQIAFS